jgi:hypothetical protein
VYSCETGDHATCAGQVRWSYLSHVVEGYYLPSVMDLDIMLCGLP